MLADRSIFAGSVKWMLSLIFIVLITYFNFFLKRESFIAMTLLYAGLFLLYGLFVSRKFQSIKGYLSWMMGIAVLSRLVLLFSFPNLSDDIFRFIWDGRLTSLGIHPFDYLPSEWLQIAPEASFNGWKNLFQKLNSPDYYSVYPPVNQIIFWLAATLFPNSIYGAAFIIKAFVISADLALIFLLYKVSIRQHASTLPALLYALNPLVIIEISGNLHFEGMMLLFLVLSLYLIQKNKIILSSVAFSAAVLVKLHPLMLLPFFFKYLGRKKGSQFSMIALSISIGIMGLFLAIGGDPAVRWAHFTTSLRLYFQTFEFNAGIYYVLRSLGTGFFGYNPIHLTGQLLFALNAFILMILLLRLRRDWMSLVFSIACAYLAYYIFSTTVHPWYILTMLPFALLTGFRTPLLWTAVIIVSYFAYSTPDWHENFYLLSLEYTCIFVFLIWEVCNRKRLQ